IIIGTFFSNALSMPHRQPHDRHIDLVSNHCSLVVDANCTVPKRTLEIVQHAVVPDPSSPADDRAVDVHVHWVIAATATIDELRHPVIPGKRNVVALGADLPGVVHESRLPTLG